MATRESFRATGRDTSPGHWPSRIPNTLSLNPRFGLVPCLNLRRLQPRLLQQTKRSFSTCADDINKLGEHHSEHGSPNAFFRSHAARLNETINANSPFQQRNLAGSANQRGVRL